MTARETTQSRPLRVLLVANDGFSAGHVARTIAIAHALGRRARARSIDVRLLLATTSEAHALLDVDGLAVLRLPPPGTARRAGFSDAERRRLVRGALQGACEAFGPDLIVCDTFPSGPHGELVGLRADTAKRALVRRAVRSESVDEEALVHGLATIDLAILADDPVALEVDLPIRSVRVPPITIGEARDAKDRATARRELGLPLEGRAVLVAAGGGGDATAVQRSIDLASRISRINRINPALLVVRAAGPLERAQATPDEGRVLRVAPLQPWLAAFDGGFAPAGYNTAHELAKAGVKAALFAEPRPFDDQAARAARFAERGLALALPDTHDDAAIAAALDWMQGPARVSLEGDGGDRAADALLDLVTG